MYGHRCTECGAYLDPGEKCDCKTEAMIRERELEKMITREDSNQYKLRLEVTNEKMATA